jgi:hypothetical protein
VCLLSPRFRQLTERTHTAGETEKEKGEKKKKKNLVESGKEGKKKTFLVSCPPKTANTRKDIYLFIY